MGFFHVGQEDDLAISPGAKDGRIYKIVQLASITVFLLALTIWILEMFRLLNIGSTANGIICSIGVIGLGGMSALPWVRVFESIKNKRIKTVAIVFLSAIGLCVILWIVCVWSIIGIINDMSSDLTNEKLAGLDVIRISLIVSIQFMFASNIAMNIVKYRKELLPYQIMSGVSKLYMDFYFTVVFTAFSITRYGFRINSSASLLSNDWLLPLLIVAFMFTIFPAVVFRRTDKKRLLAAKREDHKDSHTDDLQSQPTDVSTDNADKSSVEEKLKKIKELFDKDLITKEEYDAKRAEILNDI